MSKILTERLTFEQARMEVLTEDSKTGPGKDLYMSGIFIQGGVKNQNQRVYPVQEISKAVSSIMERISSGFSVLGEVDHPADLNVNLDRVSHMITNMWMDGPCGYGKLKLLPTPSGQLIKTMLESGVKLGVSSRGSGNVGSTGDVSEFEIVTVDIVANPSAPDAYPEPIYESWMRYRNPNQLFDLAEATLHDDRAQKYLTREIVSLINNLGLK